MRVKPIPVLISAALLVVALCCGVPLLTSEMGGGPRQEWLNAAAEPVAAPKPPDSGPRITPKPSGDGVDHRLAGRGQGTWDQEALGILARLEAADQLTTDFQESYGSAKADDERFRGQPLEAYLWELDPEQHRDAIAGELVTRLGVKNDDESLTPAIDQAIGDLTRAWVLGARLRARLATVENRLAKAAVGERARLTRQQRDLRPASAACAEDCARMVARFGERFRK